MRKLFVVMVALLAAHGAAMADSKLPAITRADLATAFLRFEKAFAEHPPTGAQVAEVNRAFDGLTKLFFSGNLREAIRSLNKLTRSLQGLPEQEDVAFLRVRVEPRICSLEKESKPCVRIVAMYPATFMSARNPSIVIKNGSKTVFNHVAEIVGGIPEEHQGNLVLPITGGPFPPGRYEVSFQGSVNLLVDHWFVVEKSLDKVRAANEERLSRLSTSANLEQAIAACKARNALLSDSPSESQSSSFLADPIVLTREVADEIQSLEMGKNPYSHRPGDYWRTISAGQIQIPFRVYCPSGLEQKKNVPLVVAFHGAGGDENMFMDGYGLGLIKKLADKNGFIVASPATSYFANPAYFDTLLAVLTTDYDIDRSRVYCIGHSMGAGMTEMLVQARPKVIKAACCLAGGGRLRESSTIPPMLVIAGELDPLIPASRLEPATLKAKNAGKPVEFRKIPDQGHTLIVATQLEPATQWLLKH